MKSLDSIQKLESKYYELKSKEDIPEDLIFITEHAIQYLKEAYTLLEGKSGIFTKQKMDKLYEFAHLSKRYVVFEDRKKVMSKNFNILFNGLLDMIESYVVDASELKVRN